MPTGIQLHIVVFSIASAGNFRDRESPGFCTTFKKGLKKPPVVTELQVYLALLNIQDSYTEWKVELGDLYDPFHLKFYILLKTCVLPRKLAEITKEENILWWDCRKICTLMHY